MDLLRFILSKYGYFLCYKAIIFSSLNSWDLGFIPKIVTLWFSGHGHTKCEFERAVKFWNLIRKVNNYKNTDVTLVNHLFMQITIEIISHQSKQFSSENVRINKHLVNKNVKRIVFSNIILIVTFSLYFKANTLASWTL